MKLVVLNPGGNDPEQSFPDCAGEPNATGHPPVNYHAYAACTRGSFHRSEKAVPPERTAVLVLLRRDLKRCLRAVEELKQAGKTVAVSLKESGLHQVAALLSTGANLDLFQRACAAADGAISSTPDLTAVYLAAGAKVAAFIPTPYPVDDARWDFSAAAETRDGVFIGTREHDVPSRNHAAALLIAKRLGCKTTVLNVNGRAGRKLLDVVAHPQLQVIEKRLPYPDYLRLVARHRLVLQLDTSAVPGQVAGDSLLCRVPCVGGNGAIERIAFPELCGHGRTFDEITEIALRLLQEERAASSAMERAMERARAELSFSAVAARLSDFFARLGSG